MKYLAIIFLSLALLIRCDDDSDILSANDELSYRTIAYNSLSKEDKESIISNWEKATVVQGFYQKNGDADIFVIDSESSLYFFLEDSTAKLNDGQRLVLVTFHTKDDPLIGPITIILNPNTKKAIGSLLRL